MSSHDEDYVDLSCHVSRVSEKAVLVDVEEHEDVWIPRSCLFGGDDIGLEDMLGEDVVIRVRRWFLVKHGVI